MNRLRATMGTLLVAAMAMSGTTCTLLLDHKAAQCSSNADCAKLDNHHPFCINSVCMPSGFQPAMCFFTDPSSTPPQIPAQPLDFMNACSSNAMLPGLGDDQNGCGTFTATVDDPDGGMLKVPPVPPKTTPLLPPTPASLCSDLAGNKQILYLTGSSNFPPLLQELSQVIVKSIGIVPVFRTTSSCLGVRSVNPTNPAYATEKYINDPVDASDPYPSWAQIFLGDGNPPVNCRLGGKTMIDIGESEIAQETCGGPVNPTDSVIEGVGPIIPIVFVVPKISTQKLISVAAAREIFGTGGNVPPWNTPDNLFIRGQATATLRLVGKQIGLLPNQFWGTDQGTAGNMANNLGLISQQDAANSALGIIGTDFYDQNRGSLKALGLQATGQKCAYLPDSSLTTRDKINVRDGHYPLWGRIHFFAGRQNGMPVSQAAAMFLPLFAGPTFDQDVLTSLIKAGFVPPCAMRVSRDSELGPFTYYDPPPVSCGCFFDAKVESPARPECQTCTQNADCPGTRPSCNYGFCEQEPS